MGQVSPTFRSPIKVQGALISHLITTCSKASHLFHQALLTKGVRRSQDTASDSWWPFFSFLYILVLFFPRHTCCFSRGWRPRSPRPAVPKARLPQDNFKSSWLYQKILFSLLSILYLRVTVHKSNFYVSTLQL